MSRIVRPANESLVDDKGRPTGKHFNWLLLVTDLQLAEGSGSPEGVLEASRLKQYFDTAGAAGSRMYIKVTDDILGDRTKGWELQ
jgi:hypothetical protein